MQIKISNMVEVIDPCQEIINFSQSELVLPNPEYINKQKMGLWVGKTPKTITYYKKNGNSLVLPYGTIDHIKKLNLGSYVLEENFTNMPVTFEPKKEVILYDYQEVAVKEMVKAKHGTLISPTGTGKTIMALSMLEHIGQKSLWCCNTTELLNQAKETYEKLYNVEKGDIGVIKEGKVVIGNKITFALVQTLSKIELDKNDFGAIFADEAQNFIKSINKTAMFSKVIDNFNAEYKYAFTATFHRADNQEKRITMLFGDIKHEVDRSVVDDKMIIPIVKKVYTKVEESEVYIKRDGTLDFCSLTTYLANNEVKNNHVAKLAIFEAKKGCSILILCDRIDQIETLYNLIKDEVSESVYLTGSMTSKAEKKARTQAIIDMRTGKKKILIASVKLAGTGLDIARLDRIIYASLASDKGIVTQCLGRISRIFPEKETPIFYDFVDYNIEVAVKLFYKRKTTYKNLGVL